MTGYRISKFAVALPVAGREGELTAVYHTLTEALILMSAAQWSKIKIKEPDTEFETIDQLIQQGILVLESVDETVLFKEWKARHVHDFDTIKSKVLVTRRCNNRCIYCILDPEAKDMTVKTARETDNFYLEQIKKHHPQKVRDDYLGGEPLLNPDVIQESASRRFDFCRGYGIDYGFTVTTNGTLVSPAAVAKLKRVGLIAVRISMAGPAEVHDRLRPFAGGGDTYETIMKNLETISGSIPIHIECQYDAGTYDFQRIPKMLDDMNRRHIRIGYIAFTPILEKRGRNEFCAGMGEVETLVLLRQAAEQRGFPVEDTAPSNACMADFRSNFVFDTDGSIIPCPSLQSGEMVYGNVTTGIDFVAESQILKRNLRDRCLQECELLPICFGGCRLQALTRCNDFSDIDCHYDMYRQLLESYINGRVPAL